jgi:hypothetical protein
VANIAHGTIKQDKIIEKYSELLRTLHYNLDLVTPYDIAQSVFNQCKITDPNLFQLTLLLIKMASLEFYSIPIVKITSSAIYSAVGLLFKNQNV